MNQKAHSNFSIYRPTSTAAIIFDLKGKFAQILEVGLTCRSMICKKLENPKIKELSHFPTFFDQ
jgi:hypothetical protein